MGLESGTYVDDFVTTNPPTTDSKQQGDDHLRLIKTFLRNTFPRAGKPFPFYTYLAKTADYTVLSTDEHTFFSGDGTSATVNFTLPNLASSDKGWYAIFRAKNITNAVTLTPSSGTINGSAAYTFSVATQTALVWFDGSNWFVMSDQLMDIVGRTALTAPAIDDSLPIYDLSTTTNKKIALSDLLTVIDALTALTITQIASADEVLLYDASAAAVKKATVANFRPPVGRSVENLVLQNNAGTPNTKIDYSADEAILVDANGNWIRHTAISGTIDASTTGADGCDAGTIGASTGYYVWFISDGTNCKGILHASGTTVPTLPGSYIYYKRVGFFSSDASSHFRSIYQRDDIATLRTTAISLGASPITISSAQVPTTALAVQLKVAWGNASPYSMTVNGITVANFSAGFTAGSGVYDGSAVMWVTPADGTITHVSATISLLGWKDSI